MSNTSQFQIGLNIKNGTFSSTSPKSVKKKGKNLKSLKSKRIGYSTIQGKSNSKKNANLESMEVNPTEEISYSIDNLVPPPHDPDLLMQNEILELHRMRANKSVKNATKKLKLKRKKLLHKGTQGKNSLESSDVSEFSDRDITTA